MSVLDGAFAKLARAEEHMNILYELVQEWGREKPYTVPYEDNPEKTQRSYRLRMERAPDLLYWGAYIGDVVHNLRSALDHIAWQCAGGHGIAPDDTEFPIFLDEGKFRNASRPGGLHKIRGIKDPVHRALIEAAQPHAPGNGMENDYLWILHEFDREDKHRVLTPILFVPINMSMKVLVTYESDAAAESSTTPIISVPPYEPLHDGAEIFSVTTSAPFVDMQVQSDIFLGVALRYADFRGGSNFMLRKMVERTRGIAEQFRDAGL